ncbi:MAG: hypothetical protein C0468_04015 [Planctomyces sp.]|nr:hypothetical protein [Planctomyces sp.]
MLPSAGSPGDPTTPGALSGHWWGLVRLIPPRGDSAGALGLVHRPAHDASEASAPGTLWPALELRGAPIGMAAWENRVWMVFEAPPELDPAGTPRPRSGRASIEPPARGAAQTKPGDEPQRRVVSLSAQRGPRGVYLYLPDGGGHDEAPLTPRGELVAIAGSPIGPVALLRQRDRLAGDARGAWRVMVLVGDRRWVDAPVPAVLAEDHAGLLDAALGPTAEGVALLTRSTLDARQPLRVWRSRAGALPAEAPLSGGAGTARPESAPGPAPSNGPAATGPGNDPAARTPLEPDAVITWSDRATQELSSGGADWADATMVWANGRVALARLVGGLSALPGPAQVEIGLATPGGVRALGEIRGVGVPWSIGSLAGADRLVVAWAQEQAETGLGATPGPGAGVPAGGGATGRNRPRRVHAAEMSLWTGEALFEGEARTSPTLQVRDLQVLALVLGGALAGALLFVMRDQPRRGVSVPIGASLATPARRGVAMVLDFAPAVLASAAIYGVSPGRVLGPTMAPLESADLAPLATALGLACVVCTVTEWLTGRTLGKSILGCVVVPARRGSARPRSDAQPGAPEGALAGHDTDRQQRAAWAAADATGSPAGPTGPRLEPEPLERVSLWRAAVRNALRWFPPMAVLAITDAQFRHPGDVLAGTIVVAPDEPAGADPGGDAGPADGPPGQG